MASSSTSRYFPSIKGLVIMICFGLFAVATACKEKGPSNDKQYGHIHVSAERNLQKNAHEKTPPSDVLVLDTGQVDQMTKSQLLEIDWSSQPKRMRQYADQVQQKQSLVQRPIHHEERGLSEWFDWEQSQWHLQNNDFPLSTSFPNDDKVISKKHSSTQLHKQNRNLQVDNDSCETATVIEPPGLGQEVVLQRQTNDFGEEGARYFDLCGRFESSQPRSYFRMTGTGNRFYATTCTDDPEANLDPFMSIAATEGLDCSGSFVCVTRRLATFSSCPFDGPSVTLNWESEIDVEYYIFLRGFVGSVGNFTLRIGEYGESPPSNEVCVGAIPIVPSGDVVGNETDMDGDSTNATTTASDELSIIGDTTDAFSGLIDFCSNFPQPTSVWYSIEGTGNKLRVSACSPLTELGGVAVIVFSGTCDNLICIENDNFDGFCDFGVFYGNPEWTSVLGETYYLLVGSQFSFEFGQFELIVTETILSTLDVCMQELESLENSTDALQCSCSERELDGGAIRNCTDPCEYCGGAQEVCFTRSEFVEYEPDASNTTSLRIQYTRGTIGNMAYNVTADGNCTFEIFDIECSVCEVQACGLPMVGCWNVIKDSGLVDLCDDQTIDSNSVYYAFDTRNFPGCDGNAVCEGAIPLVVNGGLVIGNNLIGSALRDTCREAGEGVVYYSVVGDGSPYIVSTCFPATDFDTVLSVRTGPCENQVCVGSNDDGCNEFSTVASTLEFDSLEEEIYIIAVSGFSGNTGTFAIRVTKPSSPLESCQARLELVDDPAFECTCQQIQDALAVLNCTTTNTCRYCSDDGTVCGERRFLEGFSFDGLLIRQRVEFLYTKGRDELYVLDSILPSNVCRAGFEDSSGAVTQCDRCNLLSCPFAELGAAPFLDCTNIDSAVFVDFCDSDSFGSYEGVFRVLSSGEFGECVPVDTFPPTSLASSMPSTAPSALSSDSPSSSPSFGPSFAPTEGEDSEEDSSGVEDGSNAIKTSTAAVQRLFDAFILGIALFM